MSENTWEEFMRIFSEMSNNFDKASLEVLPNSRVNLAFVSGKKLYRIRSKFTMEDTGSLTNLLKRLYWTAVKHDFTHLEAPEVEVINLSSDSNRHRGKSTWN